MMSALESSLDREAVIESVDAKERLVEGGCCECPGATTISLITNCTYTVGAIIVAVIKT